MVGKDRFEKESWKRKLSVWGYGSKGREYFKKDRVGSNDICLDGLGNVKNKKIWELVI